jgi:hypothetical protein
MRPLFLLSLFACASKPPEDLQKGAGGLDSAASPVPPLLVVEPEAIDFGEVAWGYDKVQPVLLSNRGEASLEIEAPTLLVAPSDFRLSDSVAWTLEGGASLGFQVIFSPTTAGIIEDTLLLRSNDPDRPELSVPIQGEGRLPPLRYEPVALDLGLLSWGCSAETGIVVWNDGEEAVRIDGDLLSPAESWSLPSPPEWPQMIAPGESINLMISGRASAPGQIEGTLGLETNDPFQTTAELPLVLVGVMSPRITDLFLVDEAVVDILFAVDREGSMEDDLYQLFLNSNLLLDVLDLGGYRYQISIPNGDGCSAAGVPWVDETMNRLDQLDAIEAMVETTGESCGTTCFNRVDSAVAELGPGGCNEGLVRGGRLAVIGMNDRGDSEPSAGISHVTSLQALLSDPDDLVVSAFGPDSSEYGCNENPMQSWEEAVSRTRGVYLSSCTHDVGLAVETLGLTSAPPVGRTFPLSELPIVDTILMTVEGVERSDWSWDSVRNEVDLPEGSEAGEGASVEISYTPQSACPEEGSG